MTGEDQNRKRGSNPLRFVKAIIQGLIVGAGIAILLNLLMTGGKHPW